MEKSGNDNKKLGRAKRLLMQSEKEKEDIKTEYVNLYQY